MLLSWQLPVSNICYISNADFIVAKDLLTHKDSEDWLRQLWNDSRNCNGNKLRTYRLFKVSLNTESYVSASLERFHLSVLSKLRAGTLPLEIELGRFSRPKVPLSTESVNYVTIII